MGTTHLAIKSDATIDEKIDSKQDEESIFIEDESENECKSDNSLSSHSSSSSFSTDSEGHTHSLSPTSYRDLQSIKSLKSIHKRKSIKTINNERIQLQYKDLEQQMIKNLHRKRTRSKKSKSRENVY